jgi:hypothetical protein
MSAAKSGILCDIDTYTAAKHASTLEFQKQDDIRVKGKSNPIQIFIPVKIKKAVVERKNFTKSIIGRESELKVLQEHVNAFKGVSVPKTTFKFEKGNQHTHAIIIEGEAGIGYFFIFFYFE